MHVPSSTVGPEPKKGNSLAARTDDILAIIELQFEGMEPGPKLIMGDFNGSLDAFPTAVALLKEHGWTDIGNDEGKCNGKPGRATCHTIANSNESRIDFILANSRMTPAIVSCCVDENNDFPTYRPLIIEVVAKILEVDIKELQKPTNFAWMLNHKIEEEVEKAQIQKDEEVTNGNNNLQGEKEHDIRQRNIDRLHGKMDGSINQRKHKLAYAVKNKDTSTQWDLIAAGVEEGVIDCFELEGKEATKMGGRSQITFNKKSKRLLKIIDAEEENADLATRAGWLRTVAGHHTKLANRLINVARAMKAKVGSEPKAEAKLRTNEATLKAHKELAERGSKHENLTDNQKTIIKEGWKRKREKRKRERSMIPKKKKRDGRPCSRKSRLSGSK